MMHRFLKGMECLLLLLISLNPPNFPHSALSTLRTFHTPHFPHSALSTLRTFHTPHFPHSTLSTISFSTLLIFYAPHSSLRVFDLTCDECCVNGRHRTYFKYQNFSKNFCLPLFLVCFGEICLLIIMCVFPINSLEVVVFLPKSDARF